ncbi:DUF4198 domain-containing protein [Gammaproteobacteria bacterium AS21]
MRNHSTPSLLPSKFALACSIVAAITLSQNSFAHFQQLIPDRDYLDGEHRQALNFELKFTHPMTQGPLMNMTKPKALKVFHNASTTDLLASLIEHSEDNQKFWTFEYNLTDIGDHVFYVEPQPYWEPEEQKMIVHHTKVIVDGFGGFNDWDQLIGAPVEIEPLTRPYSLWVGNAFTGIVKKNGIAQPFAEVEVEWKNDGSVQANTDSYTTQVIKADANGTFSYVMPRAGWWGFAALLDADEPVMSPEGKEVAVELGGLIWINAKDMQEK